jgi:hypothetical protein
LRDHITISFSLIEVNTELSKTNIPMKYFFTILVLFSLLVLPKDIFGQVLLQLEINKEVEAIKFGIGDVLMIKTKESNDEWQKRKLERLILDQNIIIFEDGMVALSDITHLRLVNNTAAGAGKMLMGFGTGWVVFGGLAHVTTEYKFTWGTFAVGAVAVGVGWLFNKVVAKKTYRMGKNANLRIIDISFPDPQSIPLIQGQP